MMRQLIAPVALLAAALSQPLGAAEFQATLGWADRTALSLPVSGLVKEVHVRAGQMVPAGAPLVSLDPRPFDARLLQARAGVQALERKRAEAGREVERAKELYARTVLSNVELEKAHIDQQQIDGQYQQARAQLQVAEIERGYSPLKAPFPARVLSVNTAAGEAISATMQAPALVEVARAEVMDAIATLRPDEAQGLRPGGKAEVEVNGRRMAGEILALESPREGGYRLVVRVTAGEGWLAGLPAKIFTP
ncbi:MAG: efflux RND transporter periplasmic adaptor subunit [Halothiobacillaceae bacterium]|jgi:multidrug efflux system membrane fusion protein